MLKIPFLFRWQTIAVVVAAGKLVAMAILPPSGDLLNWTYGTSIALGFISAGKFPPLPDFGVYLGIEIILAPFYWIWTILPIDHPTLGTVVSGTTPAFCLWFLMKLPIFLSDILTAFLLTRIIRTFNGSERQCAIGYLSWFANPYNFYWLYFFGAMDVIPVAVVLIGLIFGSTSRWTPCTVATTIAGLLRIYPLVTLPFFLSLTKTKATRAKLVLGSLIPLILSIVLLSATSGGITAITSIPLTQNWLLDFLGNVADNQLLKLTPILLLIQFYLVLRYWKPTPNIVHLASVPVLCLLLGASTYGGVSQHFLWVSPLLSASVAQHPEESWIFALTFITAYLSPAAYPFNLALSWESRIFIDTFLAGEFWAMKGIYLLRLNLWNLKPH